MRACAQDLLPPYLDTLIGKLLGLLQNGQKLVQEGALTALASVADCAKEAFVKYYDQARCFQGGLEPLRSRRWRHRRS